MRAIVVWHAHDSSHPNENNEDGVDVGDDDGDNEVGDHEPSSSFPPLAPGRRAAVCMQTTIARMGMRTVEGMRAVAYERELSCVCHIYIYIHI